MDISDLENPFFVKDNMSNTLKLIVSYFLMNMTSSEITDLIDEFNALNLDGGIRAAFCDRFELGEGIYDAFDLYDVDIDEFISDFISERLIAEEEALKD